MFEKTLTGKVALVTGGSRGIGKAIVMALAQAGAHVHFFYHNNQVAAKEVLAWGEEHNYPLSAYQVDVCQPTQVNDTIAELTADNEQLDVLVNNSGIVRDGLFAAMSADDIRAVIDTNLIGTMNVTQAVIPLMMRQRAGKIINLSSVSAEKGGRGQTNYAASKGAINAYTKALAVELAKRKINVNAVAPGVIATSMSKDVRDLGGDEILNKILLKRYGDPQDVANAVLFLASSFADYITGEILHVDGGFKMA